MIQEYQNTATESMANGKISWFTSIAIILICITFIIGSIIKTVIINILLKGLKYMSS